MPNDYMTKWESASLRSNSDQINEARKAWKEQLRKDAEAQLLAKRNPKNKKTIEKMKKKAKDYSENIVNSHAKGWNV